MTLFDHISRNTTFSVEMSNLSPVVPSSLESSVDSTPSPAAYGAIMPGASASASSPTHPLDAESLPAVSSAGNGNISYPRLPPTSSSQRDEDSEMMDQAERGLATKTTYPPRPTSAVDIAMRERSTTGFSIRNPIPIIRQHVERTFDSRRSEPPILPMSMQQARGSDAKENSSKKRREEKDEDGDIDAHVSFMQNISFDILKLFAASTEISCSLGGFLEGEVR